jgi:hypothetical protein
MSVVHAYASMDGVEIIVTFLQTQDSLLMRLDLSIMKQEMLQMPQMEWFTSRHGLRGATQRR